MKFRTIDSSDSIDKEFGIFLNVSGGARAIGDSLVIDVGASGDGKRVTTPATATLSLFVGIAVLAAANNRPIKVQRYGWNASGKVTNHDTQAIAAGDILLPVDGQIYLARSGASDGKTGFVYAAQAVTTHTTPSVQTVKVFIRAL